MIKGGGQLVFVCTRATRSSNPERESKRARMCLGLGPWGRRDWTGEEVGSGKIRDWKKRERE